MPKNKDYRVCYENGNRVNGKEIYELHKLCRCSNCTDRIKYRRGIANQVTATTKDIEKINEVTEFLKNWTCGEREEVKTVYRQF